MRGLCREFKEEKVEKGEFLGDVIDYILVLENGRVVEKSRHNALYT